MIEDVLSKITGMFLLVEIALIDRILVFQSFSRICLSMDHTFNDYMCLSIVWVLQTHEVMHSEDALAH